MGGSGRAPPLDPMCTCGGVGGTPKGNPAWPARGGANGRMPPIIASFGEIRYPGSAHGTRSLDARVLGGMSLLYGVRKNNSRREAERQRSRGHPTIPLLLCLSGALCARPFSGFGITDEISRKMRMICSRCPLKPLQMLELAGRKRSGPRFAGSLRAGQLTAASPAPRAPRDRNPSSTVLTRHVGADAGFRAGGASAAVPASCAQVRPEGARKARNVRHGRGHQSGGRAREDRRPGGAPSRVRRGDRLKESFPPVIFGVSNPSSLSLAVGSPSPMRSRRSVAPVCRGRRTARAGR